MSIKPMVLPLPGVALLQPAKPSVDQEQYSQNIAILAPEREVYGAGHGQGTEHALHSKQLL